MRMTRIAAVALLSLVMAGCSQRNIRQDYQEPVVDRSVENAANRPKWVTELPKEPGRIFMVTTSSDALNAETGVRLAKAYALAQLSEQARTEVQTNSTLTNRGQVQQLNDTVQWTSQAVFRSIRQDQVYWEKRVTQEGQRYSVWTLWSIPEKAFYEAQQEALASTVK